MDKKEQSKFDKDILKERLNKKHPSKMEQLASYAASAIRGPVGENDFMWVEKNITFISILALERINKMDNFREKNDFLVKVINHFNRHQASMLEKYLTECDLEEFYRELNDTGIIIHVPSDAKSTQMFIRTFYEEYDWIKIIKDGRQGNL